jgi:magnesium transporter
MARFLTNRDKNKGAAAGSLIFIGDQVLEKSRIQITVYNRDTYIEQECDTFDEALQLMQPGCVSWFKITGIHDTNLIETIGNHFHIPHLILEDILNTDERPKLIEQDEHITIILKSIIFNEMNKHMRTDQISLLFGANFLLTFCEQSNEHFEGVHKRLRASIGRGRFSGSDYLCYALLDSLVDDYIINIETIGTIIEKLDINLKHSDGKILQQIYHFKTEITYMRKSIRPVKEIMVRLKQSESVLIDHKTFSYINDLDSLVMQSLEAIEIYYSMVSDQLLTYHAQVSNRANDVMKVLTIFSSIFIPLTFIASIYGTNFRYLPELNWQYGYFGMIGFMGVVTIIMLIFFRRKRWL